MQRQDAFRRRGYGAAGALLLAATFIGLVGNLWATMVLVLLAMALVAVVEEINDAAIRRGDATPLLAGAREAGRA